MVKKIIFIRRWTKLLIKLMEVLSGKQINNQTPVCYLDESLVGCFFMTLLQNRLESLKNCIMQLMWLKSEMVISNKASIVKLWSSRQKLSCWSREIVNCFGRTMSYIHIPVDIFYRFHANSSIFQLLNTPLFNRDA